MNGLWLLTRKELLWQWRSYRLVSIGGVFLLLGLGTPALLYFLPDLIALSGDETGVEIPEFTPADVAEAYFGNIAQMGLLAVILSAMGAIATERASGLAVMTLSKPAGVGAYVLSKFIGLGITLVVAMTMSSGAAYLYTVILFDSLDSAGFALGSALVTAGLAVTLALTLFASALTRSQLVAGVVGLGASIALALIGSAPVTRQWLPNGLNGWAARAVGGEGDTAWPALALSLGIVAGCVAGAAWALRNREL